MYAAAGMIVGIYLILGFLSRKETAVETEQKILIPFLRMGMFLYKRACIQRLPLFSNRQVAKDLERLHPGENVERLCAQYYVKKLGLSLLLFLVGTLLGAALYAKEQNERILDNFGSVARGSYRETAKELEVGASIEAAEVEQTFHIRVGAQMLTKEQANEIYASFREELMKAIVGKNSSLQEVTEDLNLVECLDEYPFSVEWKSGRPELVSSTGSVTEVEESSEVILSAVVSYENMEWQEEISVRLTPPVLSPEEQLHKELEELLVLSEQADRRQEVWTLPGSWNGQQIVWTQIVEDNSILLWGAVFAVAVLIYFLADKDLHDKLESRKQRMKRDYPDLVQKLVLYLGAGMTVRGAFTKIAGEYEQSKSKGKPESFVYEEMLYTCRELQAGISEGAAYEHFGRRTGLQEYIRLSTLLQQNLKKGNSTLLVRLREEADKSSLERIQSSRKLGEEAVTKLLVPMVMMLLVVMVMIMLPAFSSTTM
ncbi:MAG: hypothetical protein J1E64_13115 [Acetatifactor sp.]|nr:hypothetical protein [Acetatifactor sp.]